MAFISDTNASNKFYGTSSDDLIYGNGGNDTIYGGDGNDLIDGGSDNDWIYGGKGKDTLDGGSGNDIFVFTDEPDYYTLAGDDVNGGSSGAGIDTIRAESTSSSGSLLIIRLGKISNIDILYNSSATKELTIEGAGLIDLSTIAEYQTAGGALGQIWGSSGNDTIYGFNFLGHMDTLYGGSGNDVLYGEAGNDFLTGVNGLDTLVGGIGNDTLAGGPGADVFRFRYMLNDGADVIQDYVDGTDKIAFTSSSGASFASLAIADVTGGAQITAPSGTSILLQGVSAASLDAGDFLFT